MLFFSIKNNGFPATFVHWDKKKHNIFSLAFKFKTFNRHTFSAVALSGVSGVLGIRNN